MSFPKILVFELTCSLLSRLGFVHQTGQALFVEQYDRCRTKLKMADLGDVYFYPIIIEGAEW